MEGMSNNSITSVPRDQGVAPDQNAVPMLKKRSKSSVNPLKAALYLLSRKSSKKSKSSKSKSIDQADMGSKFSWKGLVGSMRPMHLQANQTPPPAFEAKPKQLPVGGYMEEAMLYQMADGSPSPISMSSYGSMSDISSYGSVSDMSQYESPSHTLRAVKSEATLATFWCGGDDDNDDDGGDEMIDVKAEQFIAQFYEQMRLQNLKC